MEPPWLSRRQEGVDSQQHPCALCPGGGETQERPPRQAAVNRNPGARSPASTCRAAPRQARRGSNSSAPRARRYRRRPETDAICTQRPAPSNRPCLSQLDNGTRDGAGIPTQWGSLQPLKTTNVGPGPTGGATGGRVLPGPRNHFLPVQPGLSTGTGSTLRRQSTSHAQRDEECRPGAGGERI